MSSVFLALSIFFSFIFVYTDHERAFV